MINCVYFSYEMWLHFHLLLDFTFFYFSNIAFLRSLSDFNIIFAVF